MWRNDIISLLLLQAFYFLEQINFPLVLELEQHVNQKEILDVQNTTVRSIEFTLRQLWFMSNHINYGEQGMVQLWEQRLPPTNVAWVQILATMPYVGFSLLLVLSFLWEVFFRVLQFSPLLKNQHFQIPTQPGIR